jgi:non-heme chloroperoxidase
VRVSETSNDNGPGFLTIAAGATAPDLSTNIPAMRSFVRACTAEPMAAEDWETALCFNMVVPSQVRLALISRRGDADDVLETMTVPVLVSHGTRDVVVLPSMAEHVLRVCPTAEASWYEGIGHTPFVEDPGRFNQELAAFARRTALVSTR